MSSALGLTRRRGALVALLVVLLVAVLVVVMISVLSARRAPESAAAAQLAPGGTPQASTHADGPAVVRYQDPELGITLAYPKDWRVAPSAGDVLLLQTRHADDLVLVRRTTLHGKVDGTNIADFRTVTDGILGVPQAHLNVIDTGRVRVGGLPGVFYVYTFPFKSGRGMQAQYFVFKGRDLYTLVFQTGRARRFAALAPSFDAVLSTFGPTDA